MLGAIYISNKMGPSLAKSILGSVAAKKKQKKQTFQHTLYSKEVFQNHTEDTQYGSKKLSYPLFKSENVSIANNHPQTTSASLLKTSIQILFKNQYEYDYELKIHNIG